MPQMPRFERNIRLALFGVLAASSGYVFYPIVLANAGPVSQGSVHSLEPYAIASLALTLFGLLGVSAGTWGTLQTATVSAAAPEHVVLSALRMLSHVTSQRTYGRIAIAAIILYGLVYAVISGMIVYQPSLRFSELYKMQTPSTTFVLCCGPLGQLPGALVLITDHLGLLITPANLVLMFLVSWLVGLNFSTALFAYRNWSNDEGGGWLTSIGAFLGLFTACPTCASFLFSTIVGTAGAISLALLLASLQPAFIAISVPLLLGTLIACTHRLVKKVGTVCFTC